MSGCPFPEHHKSSGRRGGGGWVVVLVVLVLLVIGGAARAAASAVTEVIVITAAVICGLVCLALLAGLVALAVRIRRGARRRALSAPVRVIDVRPAAGLPGPRRRALPAPPARVSAHPRIDAQPHVVTGRDGSCPYDNCWHNHPDALPAWRRPGKAGRDA